MGDLRSEEGSEDIANEATNTVDGKDIECVVAAKEVLQLGRVVACNSTDSTEDDSSPCRYVTGSRGDSDQTSDDTRAKANS